MNRILKIRVDDLVGSFLYYDRKEDEELNREDIIKLLKSEPWMVDKVADRFRAKLIEGLSDD